MITLGNQRIVKCNVNKATSAPFRIRSIGSQARRLPLGVTKSYECNRPSLLAEGWGRRYDGVAPWPDQE